MTVVAYLCFAMLATAAILTTIHIARSRLLPDRAIGIDMLVALVLNGLAVGVATTLDNISVSLVVLIGLLAFLGSVTIARYIERRGL